MLQFCSTRDGGEIPRYLTLGLRRMSHFSSKLQPPFHIGQKPSIPTDSLCRLVNAGREKIPYATASNRNPAAMLVMCHSIP